MNEFYELTVDEKLIEIYGLIKKLEADSDKKNREINRISRETSKIDKIIRQNDYIINA